MVMMALLQVAEGALKMTAMAPIDRAWRELPETGPIIAKDLMVGNIRRFWQHDDDDGVSALAFCVGGLVLYVMAGW